MEIERLIEQCRQGNREALGNLYKAYAQQMRGICQRYVCDPEAVDDVLHDAFIVIFTSLDRLRNEGKAEAWMAGIVRNVALKYRQRIMALKTVREDEVNEEVLSATTETEATERKATLEELMRMVDRLPEGYGKVFRLSVFEGLSHKEIAEQLGIEPHSSSSQLTRAKKMMRKMIKQYWLWLLIPLLIPVAGIIFCYKQRGIEKKTAEITKTTDVNLEIKEGDNTNIAELGKTLKASSGDQSATPSITPLQTIPIQLSAYDKYQSSSFRNSDDLSSDSVPRTVAQPEKAAVKPNKEQYDTVSTYPIPLDTVSTIFRMEATRYKNIALQRKKTKDNKVWNLFLTYNGSVQGETVRTNDYMTLPSISKGVTRSTRIYNWGEYMEYVIENADNMDSLSAYNMRRVALINSNTPQEPLTEKSMHERPLTIQLLLNRQFNSHWSFTTGLSLTGMKSTFESGNENTLIYRTQRIHYLGIPLKAGFHIMENHGFTLYTSGGLQLDFPVSARLTTKYVYSHSYDSSSDSPDINTGIHAPCQLSFGVGIGLQYEILPHINIFLEPSMNYYIPYRQGIETYRTVHPFDISIPAGIKICW